ncbi:MAG: hypothetical protein MZU97_00900 [Bacillus subtilis]|nr:hypothetical protein [Bacillus subtilis]
MSKVIRRSTSTPTATNGSKSKAASASSESPTSRKRSSATSSSSILPEVGAKLVATEGIRRRRKRQGRIRPDQLRSAASSSKSTTSLIGEPELLNQDPYANWLRQSSNLRTNR